MISIIIFGMFMTGMFIVIGGMYGDYGATSPGNSSVYNKIDAITQDTNSMQTSIKSSGASPIGFLEYISSGAWSSLVLFFNSGAIIAGVVTSIGNDYNIPSVYIMAFIAITSITIIFGVISAIFRKKT